MDLPTPEDPNTAIFLALTPGSGHAGESFGTMPPPEPIQKAVPPLAAAPIEQQLYRSPSTARIRVVAWFTVAVMLGSLWAASGVLHHLTVANDSAELAPLPWRITAAAIIAALGVGLFGGMLFFLRIYSTRLLLLPYRQNLRLETLTIWGRREKTLPLALISRATYHHGRFSSAWRPTVEVNAPWQWVHLKRGTGFMLDARGEFIDRALAAKLLPASFQIGPPPNKEVG